MNSARRTPYGTVAVLAVATFLLGCVERKVSLTSTPPGALVWLNEKEIGRTPCDAEIVHFGTYDVRLELDGFEPIVTHRDTEGNAWDNPPLDFFAEIWPGRVLSETRWHFALVARDDSEAALLDRAAALRDRTAVESKVHAPTGEQRIEQLERAVEQTPTVPPAPSP